MDGRTDRQLDRQAGMLIGVQADVQVGEWMGWQVNLLVSWLVGLARWLFETLEIKLFMFFYLMSFSRQIIAISDFSS
jgi:hypothetical protein